MEPLPTASESIVKVTAGLIAAMPFVAEIHNLREGQRQDLRLRIKYPDQNVHFVVPRMRDLKQIMTENGFAGELLKNIKEVVQIESHLTEISRKRLAPSNNSPSIPRRVDRSYPSRHFTVLICTTRTRIGTV